MESRDHSNLNGSISTPMDVAPKSLPAMTMMRPSPEPKSYPSFEGILKFASNTSESLTLTKQVSKQDFLLPGDVITTTITISNDGDPLQFYVVEDEIPTGTIFVPDSVEIPSITNSSEITHDEYSTGIHFFFPILPSGTTEITYQLQVDSELMILFFLFS